MAQGHLTTTETQDVDLILCQAPKSNIQGVPSHCSFHVNNTMLEFPRGSIASGKSPTIQPVTKPSEFIAKQAAYPPDSYSRRELNVRTLWSVLSIKDRGNSMGKQCSNLLHIGTVSCLILLLLICVFLAFLMMHCNKSSLKPAIWPRIEQPCVMAAPSPARNFAAWAGRGPSSAVFFFGGLYNLRSLWLDA